MRIFLILLFGLSGCASTQWTTTDSRLEWAFQVVNIADAYTTAQIQYDPTVEERAFPTKQLIGINPSGKEVAVLFATYSISHYLIARALPPKWRRYYQVGTIGASTAVVINNCQLGLCD